jgi:hypothetical protein
MVRFMRASSGKIVPGQYSAIPASVKLCRLAAGEGSVERGEGTMDEGRRWTTDDGRRGTMDDGRTTDGGRRTTHDEGWWAVKAGGK